MIGINSPLEHEVYFDYENVIKKCELLRFRLLMVSFSRDTTDPLIKKGQHTFFV